MNKKVVITTLVIVIASIIGYGKLNYSANNKVTEQQAENITIIKLSSLPNGNYTKQQFLVKRGTKVRIEGDPNTLVGSMSQVIIDGYEISKEITQSDNILEFTADKPGKFRIHCANGMGNGFLTVK